MNLRDRLKAIDGGGKPRPAAKPASADCFLREELIPLADLPAALSLRGDTLRLMQAEPVAEPFDPRRILYLDTETTGLGGAGTVVFELGLGWLTDEGFQLRQYVLRDYPEEPFMLRHLSELLPRFDLLCTFNGRTFDLPLLRDRMIIHRMDPDDLDLPHIDLLPMARRLWKLRLGRCNLTRLEEIILGALREDDLPGSEAPERFFRYLKTGDFSLLEDVLRHNRQDVLSMCLLLSRMAEMYERPETIPFGSDLYAMGVALERQRHVAEARVCYRLVPAGRYRAAGRLRLAASHRRAGEGAAAAALWQEMIARREGGVTPYVELAKYHEHALRDPDTALELTRQALLLLAEPGLSDERAVQESQNALQYRYARLRRKCRAARKGE